MARTLIVDDIAVFRETFKLALCNRFPDMVLAEAVDDKEVFEKLNSFRPDLIFMDIRLPGKSGLELTQLIKQKHPEVTVIILTDYDLPEYREAALQGGADDFIPKGSLKMSAIETLLSRYLTKK